MPPGQNAPPPEIVERPEMAQYVAHWMEHEGDAGFIAEENGVAVGAAWMRLWQDANRGYGFVDAQTPELSIAVTPGYRDRGIGTELLRRLLNAAQERFDAISLSVAESNPAQHLYEREGFTQVAKQDHSILMVRRFDQPSDA